MNVRSVWRAARQWVPFSLRTITYGTLSIAIGPLTRDRAASLWAMRKWCQSSARSLDIAIEASGTENVPPAPFVYCSNHQSLLDILVLGAVLRGDFKWAAKRSLMRIPFLGWHLRLAGHVPVDRRAGSRAAAEVIQRFVDTLAKGKPLLVFPEGTRSETGIVQPFKNGGFYAAVRANVPVVPVALEGTHRMMKKGERDTGEDNVRHVRVCVGKPIRPLATGREGVRVNDLRERTYAAIVDLHASIGGALPTREAEPAAQAVAAVQPSA